MSTRWLFKLTAALVFGMLFLTAGNAFAGKPIPSGKDAYTADKFEKELCVYRRNLLDVYEKITKDPPEVRETAKTFQNDLFNRSQEDPASPTWNELNARADKLLADGASDPLVLASIGLVKMQVGQNAEAKPILIKAVEKYADAGYPARMKLSACHRLRAAFAALRSPNEAWEPYKKDFVQAMIASMEEISEEPKNRRFFWVGVEGYVKLAANHIPADFATQTAIYEAAQKSEKIDPWLKNMVCGCHHYTLGWKLRGNGYANTVTAAGMKGFAENMAKASEYFTKAWEIDPKFPEAAANMVDIAMGGGDEQHSPRDWFDRAVEAQMDYDPAYKTLTWSLLPRWGGTHEEMYNFGLECLATKRFDTGVPEKFIQVLMDIDNDLGRNCEIWQEDGVFENVKQVIEGVENEPSRRENKKLNPLAWDYSAFCLIAAHAKQYDEARKVLDKMGGRLNTGVFLQFSMRFPYDLAKIYAFTGKARDEARAFDALVADNNYREPEAMKAAREQLDKAVAKDTDPLSKPYFDYWNTRLKWQEQFDKGEWVDLTFDKYLLMWDTRQGSWIASDDGHGLVGDSESNGGKHQLKCTVPFDSSYELECDMECLMPDSQMLVGVMMGNLWYSVTNDPGCMFSVSFEQKAAYFTSNSNHWPERFYLADPKKCHLKVKYWHNFFEFFVDGQFITQQAFRDLPDRQPIHLAYQHGKAQYKNIRIRKLSYGAPPANEKYAERLAYFEEALHRDPQDAYAYFERGIAHKGLGQNEEGMADYRKAAEIAPGWPKPWFFIAKGEYQQNHYQEALDALDRYTKMLDDNPNAFSKMAAILATAPDDKVRNGKLAVEKAEKACQLTGYKMFDALQILAAAHAEAGNFDEAIKWANKGIELAPEPQKQLLRNDIEHYKAKEPLRTKPMK